MHLSTSHDPSTCLVRPDRGNRPELSSQFDLDQTVPILSLVARVLHNRHKGSRSAAEMCIGEEEFHETHLHFLAC